MSILNDKQILELCQGKNPMISPFLTSSEKINDNGDRIISKGLTSMGYDVTLAEDVVIFNKPNERFSDPEEEVIDPKRFDQNHVSKPKIHFNEVTGEKWIVLPPNSYLLGHTVEYFNMPEDVFALCFGKSTYARSALQVNATPIEPGFEGQVVIELANSCKRSVRVYLNEGISQFVFMKSTERCLVSYRDRSGKYQGQMGITFPKV